MSSFFNDDVKAGLKRGAALFKTVKNAEPRLGEPEDSVLGPEETPEGDSETVSEIGLELEAENAKGGDLQYFKVVDKRGTSFTITVDMNQTGDDALRLASEQLGIPRGELKLENGLSENLCECRGCGAGTKHKANSCTGWAEAREGGKKLCNVCYDNSHRNNSSPCPKAPDGGDHEWEAQKDEKGYNYKCKYCGATERKNSDERKPGDIGYEDKCDRCGSKSHLVTTKSKEGHGTLELCEKCRAKHFENANYGKYTIKGQDGYAVVYTPDGKEVNENFTNYADAKYWCDQHPLKNSFADDLEKESATSPIYKCTECSALYDKGLTSIAAADHHSSTGHHLEKTERKNGHGAYGEENPRGEDPGGFKFASVDKDGKIFGHHMDKHSAENEAKMIGGTVKALHNADPKKCICGDLQSQHDFDNQGSPCRACRCAQFKDASEGPRQIGGVGLNESEYPHDIIPNAKSGVRRGSSRYGTVRNGNFKSRADGEKILAMYKEDLAAYEKEGNTRNIAATKKDIAEVTADLAQMKNANEKAQILTKGGGASGWIIADQEGRKLFGPYPSYSAAEADFKRRDLVAL